MQAVTGMLQHLTHPARVKSLQIVAKQLADHGRTGALVPGWHFKVLVNVVVLQPLQRGHRVVQTGRGHAPGPNGRPHQIHGLAGLGQPLPKDEPVQRPQQQALGATCGGGDGANGVRRQPVLGNDLLCQWTRVNVQRVHVQQFMYAQPSRTGPAAARCPCPGPAPRPPGRGR